MLEKILFHGLLKFLDLVLKPLISFFFKIYYSSKDLPKPLPKCKSQLLLIPAHKLAKMIRSKEITSEQLVSEFIERIKVIQPLLNCVVQDCFEKAIKDARKVDGILSLAEVPDEYSELNAPLLGVPYSCKECIWVKNMSNNSGLVSRKNFKASEDAIVIKYMNDAGAILTCLTNTSEVCMWLESSNYVTGTTRNPYNLSRIVGGSSGGEGCIVSSCGAVIGIGSDIGGSIRMPSFFNGVYGHKPSSHIIPNEFQFPEGQGIQKDMLVTGPIVRYASDLRLLFRILSGPKYNNFKDNFEKIIDLKKLKYYYIEDLQGCLLANSPSKDTKNALSKAIKFLANSLEIQIEKIKNEKIRFCFEMWSCMMNNCKHDEWFRRLLCDDNGKINLGYELLKSIFGLQDKHTLPSISFALTQKIQLWKPEHLKMADELRNELKEVLKEDGILLFPSFPIVAPYHNQALLTNSFDFIYYGIFNVLGFPVTQIPLGLNPEGLPIGVQLVANHNMDHLTIKLAEYFESNLVGWIAPF